LPDRPLKAVVVFQIDRQGRISHIRLKESSGFRPLDEAALNAVRSVSDLEPLPEDYPKDSLGVIFTFYMQWPKKG